jgi:glycerophosphoryl diester phosphodiesterase
MYADLPIPAIFAHRGSSAYAPENTIAAFKLAVQQNADGIELDAKLSADEQVVVIHDQTIDRTTNGEGVVKDLPLHVLKQVDAGSKCDRFFCNERIPTLNEVFETVGRVTFINVELTNYASTRDSLPAKVADIVKHHHLQDRVLFSSFNPFALRKINRLLPEVPIGLLTMPGMIGAWAGSLIRRWVPYTALHLAIRDTKESLIKSCHKHKNRVYTYTANHTEVMLRLFKYGVDGIFTDDPPLARRALLTFKRQFSKSQ